MISEIEDNLILNLREIINHPDDMQTLVDRYLRDVKEFGITARKARWAYAQYKFVTHQNPNVPVSFINEYLSSLKDFFLYAAMGRGGSISKNFPGNLYRKLILGWHFPEYPLFVQKFAEKGILVLAARRAPWMEPLINNNCLYQFRKTKFSSVLPKAFQNGRPVFAMIDYCYEDGSAVIADFMGYPSRIPSGVYKLAEHYNYEICLISSRSTELTVVESFPANLNKAQENALRINKKIESEILLNPSRWLMWPSVNKCWVGVNYN